MFCAKVVNRKEANSVACIIFFASNTFFKIIKRVQTTCQIFNSTSKCPNLVLYIYIYIYIYINQIIDTLLDQSNCDILTENGD